MKPLIKLLITFSLTILSPLAMAHDNHLSSSLLSGMTHPLIGFDHLVALILCGVLIARLNSGQCIATGAVTFALILGAVGALLFGTQTWLQTAWVEAAILLSIPLFFSLLWIQRTVQKLSVFIMSIFMIAHGWAHGIEVISQSHNMQHIIDNTGFMFGFVLTCTTLVSVSNVITTAVFNNLTNTDHARP